MSKNSNRNVENVPANRSPKPSSGEIQINHFVGPLPPPDIVKQYDQIQPGLADRIFKYAEVEQGNRHSIQQQKVAIENREVSALFWAHAITNVCITTMFVSLLIVGSYALYLGHTKTALAIFAVPIGRMVIAMTYMVRREPKNNQ